VNTKLCRQETYQFITEFYENTSNGIHSSHVYNCISVITLYYILGRANSKPVHTSKAAAAQSNPRSRPRLAGVWIRGVLDSGFLQMLTKNRYPKTKNELLVFLCTKRVPYGYLKVVHNGKKDHSSHRGKLDMSQNKTTARENAAQFESRSKKTCFECTSE